LEHAAQRDLTVCIESTGQQVNPSGGYAGMTPKQFAGFVQQMANTVGLRGDQVVLGGDHLGPEPWRSETSEAALGKAHDLIGHCVQAGYRKLHLDPSQPCKDDLPNGPDISIDTIAERTARLCQSAEEAAAAGSQNDHRLVYVLGTDVPMPGGQNRDQAEPAVSSASETRETLSRMHRAFLKRGLESAWSRCVAIVVQTGAAFGPESVWCYDGEKTKALKKWIGASDNWVYEAHSTDFQTEAALSAMVKDHFAILKAGPCLTFAMREALYALAFIEREWSTYRRGWIPSRLPAVMEALMLADRKKWRNHYRGDDSYLRYVTAFGFSDRVRYYWNHPRSRAAVRSLFANLSAHGIPLPLLSQYMPAQYEAVREGRISCAPQHLVKHKIMEVLERYAAACGHPLESR
jgi:D-tagatose-1,6-bisphosphate aldolase subunit GatZ/KbaZ